MATPKSEETRSLREHVRNGRFDHDDFWRAFWSGAFERAGKTSLEYGGWPGTREYVRIRGNALGASRIQLNDSPGEDAIYRRLADVSFDALHPSFKHEFEHEMLIPDGVIEDWLSSSDDPRGSRIKRVIREARRLAKEEPGLSHREIGKRLSGLAGFSEPTLRKILAGDYPAQRKRGIRGLDRRHR